MLLFNPNTFVSSTYMKFNIKIYKTILPVVTYDCEIWSLKLREERRLKSFENKILGRILGSKRDENGEWRTDKKELNSLYRKPNIVRVIKY